MITYSLAVYLSISAALFSLAGPAPQDDPELAKQASLPNQSTERTEDADESQASGPPPVATVGSDSSKTDKPAATESCVSAALVLAVAGTADQAATGTSPLKAEGWTPILAGDELLPGTLIRTGLRSSVTLQFGETTTVSVRSASFASVDQFFRSAGQETVRVGLGYGAVRGGSSEGTIRSSVEVDTPVATLAKRGTEGWQISVEAGTGRFIISLAEYGLVEALQKLGSRSAGMGQSTGAGASRAATRLVRPGEHVNESTIVMLWVVQDIFDRKVWSYDPNGQSEAEAAFAAGEVGGYDTLSPGGGREWLEFSARQSGDFVMAQYQARSPRISLPGGFDLLRPIDRPEGNFGTAATFRARR